MPAGFGFGSAASVGLAIVLPQNPAQGIRLARPSSNETLQPVSWLLSPGPASPNRHKIVVIEQDADQLLLAARAMMRLLLQERDALLPLGSGRRPGQNPLEGSGREGRRVGVLRSQCLGQEAGVLERQLAVGQCERLLRLHALLALVALGDGGTVE